MFTQSIKRAPEMYKKAWRTCKVLYQSKPVVFLPFLFSSPSLLLKLPLIVIQKFCYHGNVTSHFSSLKNQLVPTATRTSNLRPLLRMLACQEGRRRWVRGCIKITESMHAYGFQVLPSLLFFWSAACRYSCSQKWYPLIIITRPYRGLSYLTAWVEILADAHHIFCRGDFSARKNVLRSLRFHSSQGGLFCVSLFVSFLEPEWNTRDSKVRSFWSSFICLVSLSLQSLGEASHL